MVLHKNPLTNQAKLILFGGLGTDRLNDLWSCDLSIKDQYKWKKLCPGGDDLPMTRNGHTAVLYRNEMFVYGGVLEDNKSFKPKEDILIYDITGNKYIIDTCFNKNDLKWRRNHTAESIGIHMLINGGIDENSNILSDTWLLDYVNLRWVKVEPKGIKPVPLAYHSSCFVMPIEKRDHPQFTAFRTPDVPQNKLVHAKLKHEGVYLWGGMNEFNTPVDDLYIIKVGKKPLEKIQPKLSGIGPQARVSATMTFYQDLNIVLIHGGRNDKYKKGVIYNDFWLLDLENLLWIKLKSNDGIGIDCCEQRFEHCSVINNNKLIIFGGASSRHFLGSDLFIADLDFFDNKLKKSTPRNNIIMSSVIDNSGKLKSVANTRKSVFSGAVFIDDNEVVPVVKKTFLENYIDNGDKIFEKIEALKLKNGRNTAY